MTEKVVIALLQMLQSRRREAGGSGCLVLQVEEAHTNTTTVQQDVPREWETVVEIVDKAIVTAQDARVKKMMKLCGQDHCSDGGDSYEAYLQIFQQWQPATLDVIVARDAVAAVVTAPSAAAAAGVQC